MDITLLNTSSFNGTYDGYPLEILSNTSEVILVEGLVATKTADRSVWVNGYLTYTIVITNNAGQTFVAPKFTDTIDSSKVVLDETSIKVDDVTTPHTYTSDILSIDLPDIEVSDTVTITFRVSKA